MIYQIYFYYKEYFPIEIRDHLSQWMIAQPISVNRDAARNKVNAKSFLTNMIQEIKSQAIAFMEINNSTEITFIDAAEKISLEILDKDPVSFYTCLNNCVNFVESITFNEYEGYKYVFKQIDYIKSLEEKIIPFNTVENRNLIQDIEIIINLLNDVLCLIVQNYLNPWKNKQRFVVKKRNDIELDIIQGWYENIAQMCWNMYTNSKRCMNFLVENQQDIQNPFITLHENAKNLLTNLITSSFIIEKHPPQVLKLKTKFQSSVRLLFGNVLPFKPEKKENVVTVLFVNELQAQEIQRTRIVCSRRILTNDLKLMEYNSDNKTMNAAFKKMILKRRPANEGPAHDSVMDRKYALCFKLKISLGEGEGEFVISLWTISIPVVVVSHGNQKLQAWATIFWDSSISRYNNGLLDQVNVPWDNLSRVLSIKFSSSMGFDGHFLTEDNIAFLKFKLFGGHFLNNDLSITWNEFRNGSMISNPELSFWNWFYMAMKLTQDHLRALWGDRRIIGFIDKTTAENYLLNQACDQGTFIIRFPDSKAGAISIAWKSSSTTVTHVFPLVSKDLEVRSLADCIMDCQELTKFYPNIGKLEALRNYISPPIVVPVGMNYVSRNIRAAIA